MSESLRIRASIDGTAIERLLQLDGAMTLAALHEVLQCAFGWEDRHLHDFSDQRTPTADALRWLDEASIAEGDDGIAETEWSVSSAFAATAGELFYSYDAADGWIHQLELLASRPVLDGEPLARIVEGTLRGPLEDSGGPSGYARIVEAYADPADPGHREIVRIVAAQLGPWRTFDPEAFDLDAANAELARLDPSLGAPVLLQEFAAGMAPGDRRAFLGYLAPLVHTAPPDPSDVARFLRPYLWFLDRVGTAGIPVTEAGWLPPSVVREVMDELGWAVRYPGQIRSESTTPPVRMLKDHLRRLGLVRKYRGRLSPQVKTAAIAESADSLWRYLAGAFPQLGETPAERDAGILYAAEIALGSDPASRDERVAFGLAALGWQVRSGEWPTAHDAAELTLAIRQGLADLGDPVAPWPIREPTPITRAFARAIVLAAR